MAAGGGYRLRSEMARVCLPTPQAQVQRHLAWTNSICLLFLIVGVVGFRPTPPPPPQARPLEQPVTLIAEPLPPPPTPVVAKTEDEPKDTEKSEAPNLVMTVRDTPAVSFSIPTVGNVEVAMTVAAVPPVAEWKPKVTVANAPSVLTNTGAGGDRPQPTYPPIAQQLGQQGKVKLLLTVDEAGVITSVEVQESSGHPILDKSSVEYVKRHWTLPPGAPGRLFLAPFNYHLNTK